MNLINLSINPLYRCNFRCEFCYLTEEQLASAKILKLKDLYTMLSSIKESGYHVKHIDLYGGEIALLPKGYLEELDDMLYSIFEPQINIITNLSKIHPFFLQEYIDLSVSFDFQARQSHEIVLQNILSLKKNISILMLASPKLIKMDVLKMIRFFNGIQNIKTVEIKPYSSNQANVMDINYHDFEEFIKEWIKCDLLKKFEFINEIEIMKSINKERNAFSDDHLYITPSGKFAVLEFDQNDNEFFLELNDIYSYEEWKEIEYKKVTKNQICSSCSYLGNCLTEHYRDVKSLKTSCNGFYHLLNWSKSNIKSKDQTSLFPSE